MFTNLAILGAPHCRRLYIYLGKLCWLYSYESIGDYTFIYLMSFLVGGLEHGFYFPNSWDDDMMIQSDELIFFRGVGIPPTC